MPSDKDLPPPNKKGDGLDALFSDDEEDARSY